MKQLIYFTLLFVLFACSNASRKKESEASYATESIYIEESNINPYATIVVQKFENYTDLLRLKNKHPELEEDINLELQNLSKKETLNILSDADAIIDWQQIENIRRISDHVQKVKLLYSTTVAGKKIKDSVFAYIKTSAVTLNGTATSAHKITFAKE